MLSKFTQYHLFFLIVLVYISVLNLGIGSVKIPVSAIYEILFDSFSGKESWFYIITQYRLPKLITCIIVGCALSVAGMLMQTLFQNPMAEPYVLGVSSGASLGVAICILGTSILPISFQIYFSSSIAISTFALVGSAALMLLILILSQKISNGVTLLIIGLMFSSFTAAFVNVLAYLSSAEELKKFTLWNLGSLGNVHFDQLFYMIPAILLGLLLAFLTCKNLNSLLLGEIYAQTLGINLKRTKFVIILATCILVAVSTAFVGPIGFIGLAVPHITRIIYKTTNHFVLLFGNILIGSCVLVSCDILCQLPGEQFVLPINAVTSMLGAPIVIILLLKRNNRG